ncbi:MAG: TonB-dependent receptor domain-containing protein [Butyricimonas faecihominis]
MLGNPDLKWERSQNLDLGIDLQVFKVLNATLGYYRKVTNDLIGDITLPASTGFKSYKSNLGKVVNKGVELSVNASVIQKRNISLNVYGTLAHNENILEKISDALKEYNSQVESYLKDNPVIILRFCVIMKERR